MLIGRIFDDHDNRMSPTHARKHRVKYRYYLSSALLNGMTDRAGSVRRVPADEIEKLVTKSVREQFKLEQSIDDRTLIDTHVSRVQIRSKVIVVHLAESQKTKTNSQRAASGKILHIPWHKAPSKRCREILVPEGVQPRQVRPIRAENRATLVASIARGRRWLNELTTDAKATAESIAKREGCSARKVNMTVSLAFLAPNLVRAAIEGRLPHGMGVTRLVTCRPSGPANTKCLVFLLNIRGFERRLFEPKSRLPGNGILRAETKAPKRTRRFDYLLQRAIPDEQPGQFDASCRQPGNLCERQNAWWARED